MSFFGFNCHPYNLQLYFTPNSVQKFGLHPFAAKEMTYFLSCSTAPIPHTEVMSIHRSGIQVVQRNKNHALRRITLKSGAREESILVAIEACGLYLLHLFVDHCKCQRIFPELRFIKDIALRIFRYRVKLSVGPGFGIGSIFPARFCRIRYCLQTVSKIRGTYWVSKSSLI